MRPGRHDQPKPETTQQPPADEPQWPGKYWQPDMSGWSKTTPYAPFASQAEQQAAWAQAQAKFRADWDAWWYNLHPQTGD